MRIVPPPPTLVQLAPSVKLHTVQALDGSTGRSWFVLLMLPVVVQLVHT